MRICFIFALFAATSCSFRNFESCHGIVEQLPNDFLLDEDSAGLSFLSDYLESRRVVVLGLANHADGTSLDVEYKLIKYLHDCMGFNFVLIEEGFYGGSRAKHLIESGLDIDSISKGYSTVMTNVILENYRQIYEYVLETDSLQLGGFDLTYLSPFSDALEMDISSFLSTYTPGFFSTEDGVAYLHLLGEIENGSFERDPISKHANEFIRISDELLKKLPQIEPSNFDYEYYVQLIKSNRALVEWIEHRGQWQVKRTPEFHRERDIQMASNIAWWLEHFPKEKFIICTSNFHASRGMKLARGTKTMMDFLSANFRNQLYSIAFINYTGMRGIGHPGTEIKGRSKRSLEYFLHSTNSKFTFLELLSFLGPRKSRAIFLMYPSEIFSPRQRWGERFDAIFFIESMSPLKVGM